MKQKLLARGLFRPIMLLLVLLGMGSRAWADNETTVQWPVTTALPSGFTSVGGDDNVQIKISSTNTYTNPLRFYANSTTTIKAADGYVLKSITYQASSTGNYVTYAQNATVSPEVTPSVSTKDVTWTFDDNVTEFTFSPSSQTRCSSLSITYAPSGGDTPASPLASISVDASGATTTFNQGAAFSHDGVEVTATYEDESTKDVTSSAVFSAPDMTTTGTKTVTVSYTEGEVTKTATYNITVNEYVQPTEFSISLNDAFFGTNYGGSAAGITDETPVSGTSDNVTVTYAGTGNHYINNSQIRFYPNNKLTVEAPSGYKITQIVFTAGGTWTATISADNRTYTANTKTWTGDAVSVLFTGSGSGQCQMSSMTITLADANALPTPTVTINVPQSFNTDLAGATNVSAGTLTASVTHDDSAVAGATVTWSSSDPSVATIDESTGAVTLLAVGTTTITATFAGNDDYAAATGTYELTVVNSMAKGGANNPYTVAEAITAIQALQGTNATTEKFYVRGVVRKFYGTATDITGASSHRYYIGDLNSDNELLVYSGKKSENESFSNSNDLLIGDEVTIYGPFQKYTNNQGVTPEIASGNYITSLYREYRVYLSTYSHCNMRVGCGGMLSNGSPAPAGSTITIDNIEVDDGYGTPEIVVTDANGNPVTLTYNDEQNCYTFTLNSNVTITATAYVLADNEIGFVEDTNMGRTPYGTPLTVGYTVADGYDGTLTFSLNAIADVTAENGTLTFTPKAVGGAEITITAPETAHFAAAQTTFMISVTPPEGKTTAKPAESGLIFGESFGDNSGSARTWEDEYSVKSGVAAVYADIDGYTVSNVKQGKNTTGSDGSGLNQSSQGTDASIIIGPLNVADYKDLSLTYQWKAASISGTYSTAAYYATSAEGEYTEVTGTGDGATTFVERSYNLPAAAQVSTLYLKIVWNTSNTQGIIDEIQLCGTGVAGTETVKLNGSGYATFCSEYPLDFTDAEANGYSAWAITGVEGENITFSQITGTIKGGTGVLLKGNAGATVQLVSAASTTAPTNLLYGTLAPTYAEAGMWYGLSGNTFKKINAGTVPAHKAMLPASAVNGSSLGVKAFTFVFGGTTTGIVNVNDNVNEKQAIFSLSGQRLAKPQKGINIINGKKVLVK